MKITFIRQSCFLLEWEHSVWLFDYFAGDVPQIPPGKKLFVFATHGHKDHFSTDVFFVTADCPDRQFLFSDDIQSLAEDAPFKAEDGKIRYLAPDETCEMDDGAGGLIKVKTIRSTDLGIAFSIEYRGVSIYHAGDLHWWIWEGESESEADTMRKAFFKELEQMRGKHFDIAFLPLDPRLGQSFAAGFDAMMRTADITYALPMHFWGDPGVNERLLALECSAPYRDRVVPVLREGQIIELPY